MTQAHEVDQNFYQNRPKFIKKMTSSKCREFK